MANRFSVLLCGLIVPIFVAPIANAFRSPALLSRLLVLIGFSLMLLTALFAISQSRRHLVIAAFLSVPSVILQTVNTLPALEGNDQIRGWGYLFTIIFLGYIAVLTVGALFRQRTITTNLICASLCAYLLLGLCWAFAYSLIEILNPESFSIADAHTDASAGLNTSGTHFGFALYYSFVTLTTLGYGDVIPILPISRGFSYGEAVMGQIYLAVLVARLVGLHIAQTLMGEEKGGA